MNIIKIPDRTSDNFGDPILKLLDIQAAINRSKSSSKKIFDFSTCKFFSPFLLGGVTSMYNNEIHKGNDVQIVYPNSVSVNDYLNTINLPYGFQFNINDVDNFKSSLSHFNYKNYIPIIYFPATNTGNNSKVREQILSTLNSILKEQLKLSGGVLQAVYYLIVELTQNITDHSHCNKGLIFAQFYPAKNYMDICISDYGIGLLQGYINNASFSISTDKEAISLAVKGKSTKDLPESRGFGLSTSRKMLVKGLKGKFLLWSGSALFIQTIENEEIVSLENEFNFQGCLVSLRIPTFNNKDFNFYDYTE
jgi:hypothetical protein